MNLNDIENLPPKLKTGAKLNHAWANGAASAARKDRFCDGLFQAPVAPNLTEQAETFLKENSPETWAASKLKGRDAEAFRPTRKIRLGGQLYSEADILLLWPLTPLEGFATKEKIQDIAPYDREDLPDGSIRLITSVVIGGRRYPAGSLIEQWPNKPLPGFLKTWDALRFLEQGMLEPCELSDTEA